jgi:hypothetical protein
MRTNAYLILICAVSCAGTPTGLVAQDAAIADWNGTQQFVAQYCAECHSADVAEADLDLERYGSQDAIIADPAMWMKIARRVRDHQMPPEGSELPSVEQRMSFAGWVEATLQQAACGDGITPGPPQLRRLNRSEYAATIRDLLEIHVDTSHVLPADGAGGEGFDNAAETLFISPLHAEKYLEAGRAALEHAFRDPRARQRVITAEPDDQRTAVQAAEHVLRTFLPRAFRRAVTDEELQAYRDLFTTIHRDEPAYAPALQSTLEAVLVSPHFLFLVEQTPTGPEPSPVNNYELASRLSYFLWGSMPDQELLELAAQGKLADEAQLTAQVLRMLGVGEERSTRQNREKVRDFSQNFVEQWLGTRALGREFKPDPSVARRYDSELEGGMKYEPVFFFQELLSENLSLLNLIDSDFTFANRRLARHYGIPGEFREQPRRTDLPADSPRGGVLGMAAVLAVSSYPHRTSPVLRGKWVLENVLGDPPPPPPPNVPELEEAKHGEQTPQTLRERLEQHRQNATCASCHNRIDPLGFGLENYDVLGRWRDETDGQPIDSKGTLPDGTEFAGPEELKQVLMRRKDQVMRNLTAKLLGYALGRGLTHEDYCTVDEIVAKLEADDYRAQTLILGIVHSIPFRMVSNEPH